MALTSSAVTSYTNFETILNPTSLLHPDNLYSMRETKNILSKKKLIKAQIILKLKKKLMNPLSWTDLITPAIPIPTTTIIGSCYPYQQDYICPLSLNEWHPMNTPLFTVQPVPLIVPTPSPIYATHICPLTGAVVPVTVCNVSPIIPPTFVQGDVTDVSNVIDQYDYSIKQTEAIEEINEPVYYTQEKIAQLDQSTVLENKDETFNFDRVDSQSDLLDLYLALPKELFPTPRMMGLDPNPIIDEFCRMPNMQRHTPWLLDLEFGIPRSLITRPIPTYNVKFNSINCKNAPDAIHPGFESCDPDFKRALLFYYDCIVSAWYKGYTIMNCDRSVENFQSWLLRPMQVLGMCWA